MSPSIFYRVLFCENPLRLFFFLTIIGSVSTISSCNKNVVEEIDCDISGPSLEVVGVVNAGCAPEGSIEVSASGGDGIYLYSIDGVDFQASPVFTDLSSGSFIITVMDQKGCAKEVSATVGNDESDLSFVVETTTGGCGTDEGTITVTASGGTGDYTYRVGTGVFEGSNVFDGVSGGTYTVTVKDAAGCITSQRVEVVSGVSYAQQVKPIIDTHCNITDCHGSDPVIPDWSSFLTVQSQASTIRSSTQNGTMPPDEKLTQSQIDLIACWVDDGTPNN